MVAALEDFSDRYPPMVVKELRQGMRAAMFVRPFVLLHIGALIALSSEFFENQGASPPVPGGLPGGGRLSALFWSLEFPALWVVAFIVIAFVMPLRGFTALREESHGCNSELLLLGGLTRWQIICGKWLVQMLLCGLALISLLPYILARYFIGAVDVLESLLLVVILMGTSAALSACIIGASGYRGLGKRVSFIAISGLYTGLTAMVTVGFAYGLKFQAGSRLMLGYALTCGVSLLVLFTAIGLQLGRAHLKLYLLPYEIAPTGTMVSLLIFIPFILLAGGVATCGMGLIFVIGVLIFTTCNGDRPWRNKPGKEASLTGMDTGWRPFH